MEDEKLYERTATGVLVPKGLADSHPAAAAPPLIVSTARDRASRWINLGSLAIQAATVLVLWLTFKNTVIPAQQKEFLAEQVARLEIDKNRTVAEIRAAKASVSKLNLTLKKQRSELSKLEQERSQLKSRSHKARLEASSAKRAEIDARAREQAARLGLVDARWRIFSEEASFVIWRPVLNDALSDANFAGMDDKTDLTYEQEIVRKIELFDKNWTNYPKMIREVADDIRKMRSPHYTIEMAADFSNAFLREGEKFQCKKPDLVAIKKKYLAELSRRRIEAKAKAKKSIDDLVKEYEAKKQLVEITDDFRRQTYASYEISGLIGVQVKLSEELRTLPKECSDRFVKLGSAFLEAKNRHPVQTPEGFTY